MFFRFGFMVGLKFISHNRHLISPERRVGSSWWPRLALSLRKSLYSSQVCPTRGAEEPQPPARRAAPAAHQRGWGPGRADSSPQPLPSLYPARPGHPRPARRDPAFRPRTWPPRPHAHTNEVSDSERLAGHCLWPGQDKGAAARGAGAVYPAGEEQRPPPSPGRAGRGQVGGTAAPPAPPDSATCPLLRLSASHRPRRGPAAVGYGQSSRALAL